LSAKAIKLGGAIRYFGDGFATAKRIDGRRYWRTPVMRCPARSARIARPGAAAGP
jgi:formylmethanofuran:tetrahydromethanopterin formyltransferase